MNMARTVMIKNTLKLTGGYLKKPALMDCYTPATRRKQ